MIAAVPGEILVILDAKRGDISSTAKAYAQAVFETLGADAVTINPYLGFDSLEPFLTDPEKGVFLLCKTSNPGASDLQDLEISFYQEPGFEVKDSTNKPKSVVLLHEHVARLAQRWNKGDNLGLVVGATQTESLDRIRSAAPDLWILSPGIGAQGGDLGAALRSGLRADGLGILIPVSRGVSRADDPRKAAYVIREAINRERIAIKNQFSVVRNGLSPTDPGILSAELSKIADKLLEVGCIKFGSFTLKSGIESPIYIDLRRLVGYPKLLSEVALAYIYLLKDLQFDHVGALPYAAMPIASAISFQSNWSMVYPRKEVKAYGTSAQIEGVYRAGEKVVVIDDLISTGESKFEGIEKLKSAGLSVEDVVVLIDRSPDGGASLSRRGYKLHPVLTLPQLLDYYEQTGKVAKSAIGTARSFLLRQGSE